MIKEFFQEGLKHLSIENDFIKLTFLPEIGGKMIELLNKNTCTQFLLENQSENNSYRKANCSDDFSKYDVSGFDECFPTVEECEIELLNQKFFFPDHGELWSKEWNCSIENNLIAFETTGVKWNYSFCKKIEIEQNSIIINYKLINNENFSFPFLWSAHPLLKIEEGDEIIFPPSMKKIFINWSSDETIGKYADEKPWTKILNDEIDFAKIPSKNFHKALKIFSSRIDEGFIGLHKKKLNEIILFKFNPEEIPFIGLWLCYGGWPVDSQRKHFTIALEPANGKPDSLAKSIERNECCWIDANSEINWKLEINILSKKD